jgi:hypothetical protein
MKRKNAILAAALSATMLANPVFAAADQACLQHNRIWSTRIFDAHTLVVTDTTYKKYTVRLRGACTGLTNGDAVVIFRTWQNLGCIGDDDIIGVRTPGLGFVSCYIASVQAGTPAAGGPG